MAHHVFITGGGTGIGLATARALAPTGARFTLVGRDGARVQDAAEQFENAQGVSCDVANEDSVAAAFSAVSAIRPAAAPGPLLSTVRT